MSRILKYTAITILVLLSIALLIMVGGYFYLQSDSFDEWARNRIISELESRFDLRAELNEFDFRLLSNQVELRGLRLYNQAYPSEEPAIQLDTIVLDYSILSYFSPSISMDALNLERPQIRLLEDPNDRLNFANMFISRDEPEEKGESDFSLTELVIGEVEMSDGMILYRNQPILVESSSGSMEVQLQFDKSQHQYDGNLSIEDFSLQINGLQMPSTSTAFQFVLLSDAVQFREGSLDSDHLSGTFEGSLEIFSQLQYDFDTDFKVDVGQLQQIHIRPYVSQGQMDIRGQFTGQEGDFTYNGRFSSSALTVVNLPFKDLRGEVHVTRQALDVQEMRFTLYGGQSRVSGSLSFEDVSSSRFEVASSRVAIQPILRRFGLTQADIQGRAEVRGEVSWPGLKLGQISGSASSSYAGSFAVTSAPDPVRFPYTGSVDIALKHDRLGLTDGILQSGESDIEYSGYVTYGGRYNFNVDLNAPTGHALLALARSTGLIEEAIFERYPVSPEGPVSIQAQIDNADREVGIEARVSAEHLSVEGSRIGDFRGQISFKDRRFSLQEAQLTGPSFGVDVEFSLPLDFPVDQPLNFRFSADNLPLEDFLPLLTTFDLAEVQEEASARVSGQFNLTRESDGSLSGEGQIRLIDLTARGQKVDQLEANLEVQDDRLMLTNIQGRSLGGQVTGEATWNFQTERYQVDLSASEIQLDQLDLLQQRADISGRVDLSLEGSGTIDKPSGQVRLRSQALTVAGYTFEAVELETRIQDGMANFTLSNRFQENPLLVEGSVSLSSPYSVEARAKLDELPVQPFLRLFSEGELSNFQGRLTGTVQLQGPPDDLSGQIELQSQALTVQGYTFEAIDLEASIQDGTANFTLANRFRDNPLLVEGTVDLASPFALKARAELQQLPIQPYLGIFVERELPNFQGSLSGTIRAQGPLARPGEMEGNLDLLDLQASMEGYLIQMVGSTNIAYRDGMVTIPGMQFQGAETDLQISGTVQVRDPRQIQLEADGNANLEIVNGFLATGTTRGQVQVEVDVFGPLNNPKVVGSAELEEGLVVHPGLPTSILDATGSFKFTASQVSIDSFQARTQFGSVQAEGGIFLDGLTPARWQVNVYGTGLRINYPESVNSVVDVDVDFLRSEESQLVSGVVYIRSAEFSEQVTIPELLLNYAQSQATPTPSLQGEATILDVDVEAYRSLRINNNLADVTASGDFTLRGTLQNPVIVGTITVDQGELFLENNDYEVVRGSINFNNPRRTNPVLNFEAQTEVQDYTVTIVVRGPLDQLKVNFFSEPPLPTASVVSLLAAGQTPDEIFGTEGTAQTQQGALAIYGAGAVLSKTLGQQITSRTSRLFGFERFSIDPFIDTGATSDPGARITLGKQLTSDLGITYITELGSNVGGQAVILEYQITDWLTAVGTREEDGSLGIDFKFKTRF